MKHLSQGLSLVYIILQAFDYAFNLVDLLQFLVKVVLCTLIILKPNTLLKYDSYPEGCFA